jgi:hypothetical protein
VKRPETPSLQDLERISALVDGRLSQDQKAALLQELDANDGLREVFAEALLYKEAREESGALPGRKGPGRMVLWTFAGGLAAAGLVLAISWPVSVSPRHGIAADSLAEMLASHPASLPADWFEHAWSVQRGDEGMAGGANLWFRLGVETVDLAFALHAGRRSDTLILSQRLETRVSSVPPGAGLRPLLVRSRADFERDGDVGAFAQALRQSDKLMTERHEPGADHYALGRWAEAGRLATSTGNHAMLTTPAFRDAGRRLRISVPSSSLPEWDETLALLDSGVDETTSPRLERYFADLVTRF